MLVTIVQRYAMPEHIITIEKSTLAESVCNEYFRVLLTENTRYRNGLLNTMSHVQAVRSDLREDAA